MPIFSGEKVLRMFIELFNQCFGENLGTGFPTIVSTWEKYYHMRPILI